MEAPTRISEAYLLTDDGKTAKQLTHFEGNYKSTAFHESLRISPDGHWLSGRVNLNVPSKSGLPEGDQIFLIDTRTEENYFFGGWEGGENFVWSPDSKRVALSLYPKDYSSDSVREINILDTETKSITQLTFDGEPKEVFDWR